MFLLLLTQQHRCTQQHNKQNGLNSQISFKQHRTIEIKEQMSHKIFPFLLHIMLLLSFHYGLSTEMIDVIVFFSKGEWYKDMLQ